MLQQSQKQRAHLIIIKINVHITFKWWKQQSTPSIHMDNDNKSQNKWKESTRCVAREGSNKSLCVQCNDGRRFRNDDIENCSHLFCQIKISKQTKQSKPNII